MAQHKMKQKMSLPKGAKQKSLKRINNSQKSRGPRKGTSIIIAPKKIAAIKDAKMGAEVTRIINEKNEHLTRKRADQDVGKLPKSISSEQPKKLK